MSNDIIPRHKRPQLVRGMSFNMTGHAKWQWAKMGFCLVLLRRFIYRHKNTTTFLKSHHFPLSSCPSFLCFRFTDYMVKKYFEFIGRPYTFLLEKSDVWNSTWIVLELYRILWNTDKSLYLLASQENVWLYDWLDSFTKLIRWLNISLLD